MKKFILAIILILPITIYAQDTKEIGQVNGRNKFDVSFRINAPLYYSSSTARSLSIDGSFGYYVHKNILLKLNYTEQIQDKDRMTHIGTVSIGFYDYVNDRVRAGFFMEHGAGYGLIGNSIKETCKYYGALGVDANYYIFGNMYVGMNAKLAGFANYSNITFQMGLNIGIEF